MKSSSRLLLPLILIGCVSTEKGECLDWKPITTQEERCTAMYGNIICVAGETTRYQCILREDNGNATQG